MQNLRTKDAFESLTGQNGNSLSVRRRAKPVPPARAHGSWITSPSESRLTLNSGAVNSSAASDSSSSFVLRAHSAPAVSDWHLCPTSIWSWKGEKAMVSSLPPSDLNFALCFTLISEDFTLMAPNPEAPQGEHKERHTGTAQTYQYPMDGESKIHMRQGFRRYRGIAWSWWHVFDYLTSRCWWSKLWEFLWQRAIVFIKVSSIFSSKEGSAEPKCQREKANYNYKNY